MPRRGVFEQLEPRFALAATADVTALLLRINGQQQWVNQSESRVMVSPGASLEVAGARIDVSGDLVGVGGVLQMEGYLRSSTKMDALGEFNYADGRFSNALAVDEAAIDEVHGGLSGSWQVAAETNRLSVALVHYIGDEVEVMDRFFVQLQTVLPDFEGQGRVQGDNRSVKVGQLVQLAASISNLDEGPAVTYLEVDVYHESDPLTPVWVGTLVEQDGNGRLSGQVRNDNENDTFEKFWRPDRAGAYTIKVYVDPEHHWLESSEDNNIFVFKLDVAAK
ncbi:MAG: hypothetical protein L0211_01205 [Planctomycetaceae bacterium]|nr:hypothetical protein [Planctomycetaceae bacterium]